MELTLPVASFRSENTRRPIASFRSENTRVTCSRYDSGSGCRKGQVYSLIAVLLTIPLMLFIAFYVTETQTMRYGSLERVVSDQMHEVEQSLEKDFEQAMMISGKRAFLAATDNVISNGVPLNDSKQVLVELITQGTIDGEQSMIMHDNTIQDWVDRVNALDFGFDVSIGYSGASFSSLDGMNSVFTTVLSVNISDQMGMGRIGKVTRKDVTIPLDGLEDPIFPLNTLGFVSSSLREYPYPYHAIKMASGTGGLSSCSGEVTFDPMDPDPSGKILVTVDGTGISGFRGVVAENTTSPSVGCYISGASGAVLSVNRTVTWSGYQEVYIDGTTLEAWSLPINDAIGIGYYSYFDSGSGPDMLMRLEENLTSSDSSIETFVDLQDIQGKGVGVKPEQVSIAYLYFSDQTINGQPVRGLPDWFRMDAGNAARYNLTGLM